MNLVSELRDYLIAQGLVRAPNVAGAAPPAWKHPDDGAVGPGDAEDQGMPEAAWDDGLVVSLMMAPGIAPSPGEEEQRIDGIDIVFRSNAVPVVVDLEADIRARLLGDPPDPGGRADWQMAALYVIQSKQYSALQPVHAADGIFTFRASYLFVLRA